MNNDFINLAIKEAEIAYNANEVPVGAVIVLNNKVIAQAHNQKAKTKNPLNHAEILAIQEAISKLGDWRLNDCEIYVTLEPCPMCAGAISQARIKKVYIGTNSNILNNYKIISEIFQNEGYYHRVEAEYLHNKKCASLLSSFFANKR